MTLLHPVNHFLPASVAPTINPYQLGATLYMPATRQDIWQIISQQKLAEIDSIVICLEDAVSESEIPAALANLKQLLATWTQQAQTHGFGDESRQISPLVSRPMVFIRPRNALMLSELASWQRIALVDGFVLPKIDMQSLADWRLACQALPSTQLLMPTLETRLIFNPIHNQELALAFSEGFSQSILALRIGGNDLFASLRLRRPSDVTIYQTPVGILIYQLIACFVPQGFYLTAPVFEYLDKPALFAEELRQDVALGLVGKTIIHPEQIAAVKHAFYVNDIERSQATAILAADAKAVFKQDNSMLEPATHRAWATSVMLRANV